MYGYVILYVTFFVFLLLVPAMCTNQERYTHCSAQVGMVNTALPTFREGVPRNIAVIQRVK